MILLCYPKPNELKYDVLNISSTCNPLLLVKLPSKFSKTIDVNNNKSNTNIVIYYSKQTLTTFGVSMKQSRIKWYK